MTALPLPFVALFVLVVPAAAQEPAPGRGPPGAEVEVVHLGVPGTASEALALSTSGFVVGWSEVAPGDTTAFAWTSTGGARTIDVPGTPYALDVNARGEVAIAARSGATPGRAYRWSPREGLRAIGPILPESRVWIDAAGRVFGTRPAGRASAAAFRWAGAATDLPAPDADAVVLYGVAPNGVAIGGIQRGDSIRAGVWDTEGTLVGLRGPATTTVVVAVNGHGTATGSTAGEGRWRAFRWAVDREMEVLDTPRATTHGHSIDASGRVAGVLYPDEGARRLYLWEIDGTVREIEPPEVGGLDDLEIVLADDGTAGVVAEPFSGPSIALWWSAESGLVELKGLSGQGAVVRAVAPAGLLAGASLDPEETPRAVLWRIRPSRRGGVSETRRDRRAE